eukprot:25501_1
MTQVKVPTIEEIESFKYRDLLKVLRENFPNERRKGLKTEELRNKIKILMANDTITKIKNNSKKNKSNTATATYTDMVKTEIQFWENKLSDLLVIKYREESDYNIKSIPGYGKYDLIAFERFNRMSEERNSKVKAARKLLSIQLNNTTDMMHRFAIVTGFVRQMCNLFTWLAQNPPSLDHGWGDEYPLYSFEKNMFAKLCKVHKPKINNKFIEKISNGIDLALKDWKYEREIIPCEFQLISESKENLIKHLVTVLR